MSTGQTVLKVTRLSSVTEEADADGLTDLEFHADGETARLSLNLRLLDTVRTSNVPVHFIAGSPLEVYSANANTHEWLLELLSFQEESPPDISQQPTNWWKCPATQSIFGYLLKVESTEDTDDKGPRKLTELLLYAATLSQGSIEATLLTPPPSSPSSQDLPEIKEPETFDTAPGIVFRALPLCSSASQIASQNKPRLAHGEHTGPCFIDIDASQLDHIVDKVKRRELTSVFDNASLQRKKIKRRGGGAVGQLVTNERDRLMPHGDHKNAAQDIRMNDRYAIQDDSLGKGRARQTSRSLSITSAPCESAPIPPNKQLIPLKTSQSQAQGGHGTVLPPEPPMYDQYPNEIEQQNKSSISRIIMAGMRMHGLQQRRSAVQRTISLPENGNALSSNKDEEAEEYKLVYYQTFKATTFLFRRQMYSRFLSVDDLRENIDRLLTMFCSDPLDAGIGQRVTQDRFGADNEGTLNAFDKPTAPLCSHSVHVLPVNPKSGGDDLSGQETKQGRLLQSRSCCS